MPRLNDYSIFKNSSLWVEKIIMDSPVASITIPNLDINTHKSYRFEGEIYNPTGNAAVVAIEFNNDTTVTNYYSFWFGSNDAGSSIYIGRENANSIGNLAAGKNLLFRGLITIINGLVYFDIDTINNSGRSIISRKTSINYTVTIANLTSIKLLSSVASSIGIGSKIRIYKGN